MQEQLPKEAYDCKDVGDRAMHGAIAEEPLCTGSTVYGGRKEAQEP